MLNAVWKTFLAWASAHPMFAAILLATVVAGVLSSVWYAVRRAVWPGRETAALPTWARVVQALVELMANVPGALRALASWPSTPPGTLEPRETVAPPAPSTRRTPTTIPLPVLLLLGLVALQLTGCPRLPQPDGCTPGTTRCSPGGFDEACSPGQRWTRRPLASPCAALGAVCCWTRSPYGRELHACVPQALCLQEPGPAGVDAGAEGGAP